VDYLSWLVSHHRDKGLLIDTNLLLLYFIGKNDPNRIGKFKRTMQFTIEEFSLLEKFFKIFSRVVTTPSVLTEVSNLLGQLPQDLHPSFCGDFARRIEHLEEYYSRSVDIVNATHFTTFGLTDSGIAELVIDKYLVLTDDLDLFGYLQNRGIDAINFNHLRLMVWS
jgi:hypothetical protein